MKFNIVSTLVVALYAVPATSATVELFRQDYESPDGFVNDGGDVNIFKSVNDLYGNQPSGFTYTQQVSVETLNITGTEAFGSGYTDVSGTAGDYVIGMLTSDFLTLFFDVGDFPFFNLSAEVSNIDLDRYGGPFNVVDSGAPTFEFSLFDNPTGGSNLSGNGTLLDSDTITGIASGRTEWNGVSEIIALSTEGNTNGNVALRIDLLGLEGGSGSYSGFDNLIITASDEEGDIGDPNVIPVPASLPLLLAGLGTLGLAARRKKLSN